MEFSWVKNIVNRYSLTSLAIHILILFLMRNYFNAPVFEIPQELQVEIRPPLEEKKKQPKFKEMKKPTPVVKSKPLKKRKIPRETQLPPRSFDKKAKLSMFKDGSGVRGTPKKHPPKKLESPVKVTNKRVVKKQMLVRPRKKASPDPRPSPDEKKQSPASLKSKELFDSFKADDLFTKKSRKPYKEKKKGKLPDRIMANLDEYIDADKFDSSELFGDSMLTFGDDNFRYVWYGRVVKKKVVDGWYPPIAARLGLTGKAVVTFSILRDGSIDLLELKESTGNKSLDRASLNAVKSAGYFPPLPDDYEYDKLGVVFSFWYNLSRSDS